MYKLFVNPGETEVSRVIKINIDTSVSFIPLNFDTLEYREYLKWLSEGNTPLPAGEV